MDVTAPLNTRKIIHIDMDAFYASIEQRDYPELIGKPVVVGGSPYKRGVVASASYEARKFGVRSAMSSAKALRLCPNAAFLTPNIGKYREVSHQIQKIFFEVTQMVEPLSLDEAYLDVTENSWNEPLAGKIAATLRRKIKEELSLTASAGVGPNKFIAKLASDSSKPNGLLIIPPQNVSRFVENLPVEKFWGVGPATAKRLHHLGLWTASDIRSRKLEDLQKHLGKFAPFLYGLAQGQDNRPVDPSQDTKSCGTETTFEKDIKDSRILLQTLEDQIKELCFDLKKIHRPAKTITIKVRYSDFKTVTRSRTLYQFTDDSNTFLQIASDLLLHHTEVNLRPVRLLGVSLSSLFTVEQLAYEQLWFNFE